MEFLKVSSKSSPASVAGAIAGMVKDGVPVTIQCVGAGAVNQAIKAVAIARGFLIPTGFDISCFFGYRHQWRIQNRYQTFGVRPSFERAIPRCSSESLRCTAGFIT